MKPYIIPICIVLFVAGLFMVFYAGRKSMQLDSQNKALTDQLTKALKDRRNLELMLIQRDSLYTRIRRHDKAVFDSLNQRSSRSLVIYRELKKAPQIAYNTHQIDSLIEVIINP